MTDRVQQHLYTAELARRRPAVVSDGAVAAAAGVAGSPDDALARHCEIMAALRGLAGRLDPARAGAAPPLTPEPAAAAAAAVAAVAAVPIAAVPIAPVPIAPVVADGSALVQTDADSLRSEVRALHAAIDHTRREIAALRQMGKPPAHLATATDELDAVVQATESATECILAASERIDDLLNGLRKQAPAETIARLDEIGEQVTRIFESCNFQDITGQRITKVVAALKFVEERVNRMIDVLGGVEAIAQAEAAQPAVLDAPVDDESHLLSGPQLDRHKISQDDIDRFFN